MPLQTKYAHLPSDYYIPKDMYKIRARLLKEGVFAPGVSISSAGSSRVSLAEEAFKNHVAKVGGLIDGKEVIATAPSTTTTAIATDNPSHTGPASPPANAPNGPLADKPTLHGVHVFIDIQLYQLEVGNYVVDFKCDGYQNVVKDADGSWKPISKRIWNKEKEVTSPYPYLDVASDLIAQLAVAN